MKLGIQQKAFAYSMTTLGSTLMSNMFNFYYVKLFLNRYRISEGMFHQAQVVFMLWNALNDPLFGYFQDNANFSCCAKRRLSILYGAPLYAIAFLLPWFPWRDYQEGDWLCGLHLVIALCAYDGMLTFVLLAQCALFAEISTKHENRLQLIKYNQVALLIGSSSVLFCGLLSDNMKNLFNFQLFALCIAVLAFCCMYYTGLRCITHYEQVEKNNVENVPNLSWTSVFHLTKQIITQKDFVLFVIMNFCQVFYLAFLNNFMLIFADHLIPQYLLPDFVKSIMYGAGFICPQLLILSCQSLLSKFGYYKVILYIFYVELLSAAVMLGLGPTHYYLICVFLIGNMVMVTATFSLFNLPLADIVDADFQNYKRSFPLSSMVFGTNALFTKPAQSLAPMLVVTILNQFDYEKLKDNFALSQQSVLQDLHGAMFYLVCLTPMCIAFLQILAWTPYSIRDSHTDFAKYVES
ncbi:transmembrane protein 180-like [Hemiscyllium ocellatum]|uniref:transmembrane protein 180-like n=1 Tax=Hemiscyllium ocellatum TaxID=170820 RepID=UPI002965F8DC|nr:transmembrane protein 180-like [Hemiscyllium ocellatum]XP_060696575.1 transmembrane protein 180-like [Hemiscyllium ocellatum]XP_060696576.1 transmembrane protein 180-like [Hemiscyllium ocellatum]XP_060696577.1 transmembrane protein 180-like [Hemiscyllium ocellatum]XP_060696579.1 transmembrane protein 180-like [Hemiscyllium ocellatum]XP_060696580.1 transmembrane protein 180-like [Hemiscyllium ocellatum]